MPKITITINGVDQKLSDNLSKSIAQENGHKYTHMKQVVSRIRMVKDTIKDLPEDIQLMMISNALIVERNIAWFAAEQYAMLNQDKLFDALSELAEDIDSLFK
jgi:hypothetical protein